jgi:hypothetical protein
VAPKKRGFWQPLQSQAGIEQIPDPLPQCDSHAEDKAISDRMADRRFGYQKIEGDWNGQCITTKTVARLPLLLERLHERVPPALLVLRGNFRSYDAADRGVAQYASRLCISRV